MMDTALPMANMMTQNRFQAVPVMFSAATAFSPRLEYSWLMKVIPRDHRISFTSRGAAVGSTRRISGSGIRIAR